ncbi:hypothetical protein CPC735_036750 [Coccidioides posadasii C735 delta SOWgp]|uniref:Uncharacterized protein n=1 Tax=Coccidioides posadasii (strain C735) TaxID=222929 RepID=C5P266_COCP7|nr:hypothetical protein CPC735_036750 [Coccidioides posadasii C735 delta SOWgp]EER28969.1 hypothetical protein CPC735_036750 [Coccidioides posadasii C735 delta SOWgp]|eukprot:XP_003071114.1 hypothetical protein CPC735_036750 [Coccidioides posadasii C735 delta SOWgp]
MVSGRMGTSALPGDRLLGLLHKEMRWKMIWMSLSLDMLTKGFLGTSCDQGYGYPVLYAQYT